jgi:hypothetical protein
MDPNSFSYGIMFSYPKSTTSFMMKITCYVNGKASIHLKSNQANDTVDKRLRDEILDIINYLSFGWFAFHIVFIYCLTLNFKRNKYKIWYTSTK